VRTLEASGGAATPAGATDRTRETVGAGSARG